MEHRLRQDQQILWRYLRDARASFSVGSYGAVAEFHRRSDEPLAFEDAESLCVITTRGGIRISNHAQMFALAYETLSRRRERWQQGVVFCLPEAMATRSRRRVLSEIGPDFDALRARERGHVLFDLGLNARNVDFCVRTADPALLAALRKSLGTSVLDPANSVLATLIEADPHRVVLSSAARAEVYQPIGREVTPEGPHTHVLPKLLRTGRTHSANVPVPKGLRPVLSLHPPNPAFDALGEDTAFDAPAHREFSELLERWGLPEYRVEKQRAMAAVFAGKTAQSYPRPAGRLARTAVRVALRQLERTAAQTPGLRAWTTRFDAR